mgnify:CR=1 FL=1
MERSVITIAKCVYGGYGLGFLGGRAVFIPYTLPGDIVAVEITDSKKSHAFGRMLEIITPSPSRRQPECPNFSRCGGCDYLHADYATELEIKSSIAAENLKRIAKLSDSQIPEITCVHGPRLHYRSHARIQRDSAGHTGFFARASNTLVPLPAEGCVLLDERITQRLNAGAFPGNGEFRLAVGADGRVAASVDENTVVRETENGLAFERDIDCFFQANRFLRTSMLNAAAAYAGAGPDDEFIDIGCGVGFFTLHLAKNGARGTGVDIDRKSIMWANRNAATNTIPTAVFTAAPSSSMQAPKKGMRAIIVDPPRAGLTKSTLAMIAAAEPERIVYVSCDPSTFARDTRLFGADGYRIREITFIDMFPATQHIEVIALLQR